MIPELELFYNDFKSKKRKANGFPKFIKNNIEIKDLLYKESNELDEFYDKPSDLQRLFYIFNKRIEICKCGNPKSWRNFNKGYNKTCGGPKCISRENNKSRIEFYQKNFGVNHNSQTEEFKRKSKETFIKNLGVDNPGKDPRIKNKIRQTNIERFGESNWLKIKENREHISEVLIKNNWDNRLDKIRENKIPIDIEVFSLSTVIINCKTCGERSEMSTSFFNKKISISENPCLKCNPPLFSSSNGEKELLEFIATIYNGNIITHDREIGAGKEIDIFLPDLKIGFEFDGIWWHSEIFCGKNGNLDKKKLLENNGIKIYNIWEDYWNSKKDIVKSRIKNIMGISNRIYGRECSIIEISYQQEKEFLINNHIQGYVPSSIKIGLLYKGDLVSLMTFGAKRKALGQNSIKGNFELLRFCNKLDYSIIGGASKIFKYFIKKYSPKSVISYQDNSWHPGDLYKNLGFNLIDGPKPNYWWCKGNIRFHRYNFRKDKLVRDGAYLYETENQIMTRRRYFKLWDYGNLKWEYTKKA